VSVPIDSVAKLETNAITLSVSKADVKKLPTRKR